MTLGKKWHEVLPQMWPTYSDKSKSGGVMLPLLLFRWMLCPCSQLPLVFVVSIAG